MKFTLFLFVVCVGYYFLFKPEPTPESAKPTIQLPNQSPEGIVKAIKPPTEKVAESPVMTPEIRKSVWDVTFFGITLHAGIWVVSVVLLYPGGKILRSFVISQRSSKVEARKDMLNTIRDNMEKPIGHNFGTDEAGWNESIWTRDVYNNEKMYTIIDTEKLKDIDPNIQP